jgi:hypothetical protein
MQHYHKDELIPAEQFIVYDCGYFHRPDKMSLGFPII